MRKTARHAAHQARRYETASRRSLDTLVGTSSRFRALLTDGLGAQVGEVRVPRSALLSWEQRGWIRRLWTGGPARFYEVSPLEDKEGGE